ncbi:hypothetical protein ES703_62535 [subsurface metagenome]
MRQNLIDIMENVCYYFFLGGNNSKLISFGELFFWLCKVIRKGGAMCLLRAASIFIKGFLMLKASSPQLIRVFVDNDSVVEKLVRSHTLE